MQFPAAASGMILFVVVTVLAAGSASASITSRLTYQHGNKPVQSITAAGWDEPVRSVTVDQSGRGNYTSIQAAVDAVPVPRNGMSATRVLIKIMPGTYSERVIVRKNKISLIGTSASSTIVTWSGTWIAGESETLRVLGSDFVASNITFQNTFGTAAPAMAARVAGDRAAFYGCRFLSFQDTLLDDKGRHYYSECYVQGATDFIFGGGKAFFERCHLHSTTLGNGAITAPGPRAESDNAGFSFVDCNLTGIGAHTSFLGRPWRPYARVVFAHCDISNTVQPVGWDNWNNTENARTSFFGQFECYGEGSRTDGRANWTHNNLSLAEAEPFLTKEAWVDANDWIK